MQALQGKHSHSKRQSKLQGKRSSNHNLLPLSPPCRIHLAVLFEGGGGRAALQEAFF